MAWKFVAIFVIAALIMFWSGHIATSVECHTDRDCATGGCSGEICGPKEKVKNIMSACVYKPEYACLKYTSCRCIQGKCQWEKTEEYLECLKGIVH